jgi:hypothetical protein
MKAWAAVGAVVSALVMSACSSSSAAKPTATMVRSPPVVAGTVERVLLDGQASMMEIPASSFHCSQACFAATRPIADLVPVVNRVADQLQRIGYPTPDRPDANALVESMRAFATESERNALAVETTFRASLNRFVHQLHLPTSYASILDPADIPVQDGYSHDAFTATSP